MPSNMGPSSVSAHGLQIVVAAVLLIVGTISLGRAVMGRRRVPRRSLDHREPDLGNPSLNEEESSNLDYEETDRSLEETEQSNSTDLGNPSLNEETDRSLEETEQSNSRADIFLSYSGYDKAFVASVYEALRFANYTVCFDPPVLAQGRCFLDIVAEAARGCKVGVVVLSEEYLTSKWSMRELEMLTSQRGTNSFVLPLFYQLNPADLNSQKNLQKWRRSWKKMAEGEDVVKHWEKSVNILRRFNGEVYRRGTSIDAYINKVVKDISDLIPCLGPSVGSSIQGRSRLVQEIDTNFDYMDGSGARMVGLHGVGGVGKTTLCKVMVNYYSSFYSGRSFLIEFPSRAGDKSMITSECKKALSILTDASEVHLLDEVDNFDQVVQLMRDHVGRQDVFLAIDNLRQSSLDEAKRVLQAGFSAKSKILVTSRSEKLLRELLMVTDKSYASNARVAPFPVLETEEALQIFQESFELFDLRNFVDMNVMNDALKRCRFNGSYHALTLKAFAKHVKRVCMGKDLEELGHQLELSRVLTEVISEHLAEGEDVIRLSYEHLPEEKKHLFLDIVVFIRWYGEEYVADVEEWISTFHWKFPKDQASSLVKELSFDGLIKIEVDTFGRKVIGLYDLYKQLALKEIAISPRYLVQNSMEITVEKVEWEKLEMVILYRDESRFFEKLQQCECPKLKLLNVRGIVMESSKVRLNSMPSLTVLELSFIKLVENEDGSAAMDLEKKNMVQSDMLQPLEQVTGMPSSDHKASLKSPDQKGPVKSLRSGFVRGENVVHASSILRLNRLDELRKLKVEDCDFVEIAGLSSLVQLRVWSIQSCWKLQKLPDVSSLTCLESLELIDNAALEEVGCLSCTLEDVCVKGCTALKRMPDLSSLTCLERLELVDNAALEEVGGECLRSSLKHLDISNCGMLRSCPSLDECMHLETLATGWAEHVCSLQKVQNLQISLQRCIICREPSTKEIDVGWLTSLEHLEVSRCEALEEIGGLSALPSIKELIIRFCPSLKKLTLGGPSLKKLIVQDCKALEEITGDLKALPRLEYLRLYECESLKKLEASLIHLALINCESDKE